MAGSQYWGATPGQSGNQTLYNPGGSSSSSSPQYNTNPSAGYPSGPGLMNPQTGLPISGPYGGSASMPTPLTLGQGNGNPTTNIGGYWYNPNSPGAVAAARQNQIAGAGSAGTAAGTYTQSALNSIPSLQGLYSGIGSAIGGAGTGTGTGTMGASGGVVGTGAGGASTGSGAGGNYVAPVQVPDQTAAQQAAFGAAKDTVGQTARAAIDSLRGELGATGGLGGGAEATGVQNVINAGQGQLGNVTRQNAVTQTQNALDVAKTNAQLGVTERGQDVQAQQAQAQLALENRQQLFGLLGLAMKGLGGGGATGGSLSAPSLQLY